MENEKTNSKGFLRNFIWKFSEHFSVQLISTAISVILARILAPEDYGVIAIVMIFINLANVFVSDGLGSALIQKKDATELDFFSVLYFNVFFSAALYALLFWAAPLIAAFYGSGYEILTPVLRVLGLRIILTSVNSVQHAYVSKKMIFRTFFISSLFGTVLSAVIGLAMACGGFGVWALVAQYLSNAAVNTLVLAIVLRKRPKLMFSFESLKELFPYGICILGTGLLITGYQELRALVIGKVYSSADLAYYDKARHFPSLIVSNISVSVNAVLFPKMSDEQKDIEKVRMYTKNSISFCSYIVFPIMVGMAAVAEPFVCLLLTDKWIACVPLLRLFCLMYLFQPMHTANMQAIKAIGRGDIYMRLEIIKKAMELAVLLMTIPFGVTAIVAGMAVCATLATFINAYPNIKFLRYGFKDQMLDILPNLLLSAVMFAAVYSLNRLQIGDVWLLVLQVACGVFVYVGLSALTKNKSFMQLYGLVKKQVLKSKIPMESK